jgi:hypothetical protein
MNMRAAKTKKETEIKPSKRLVTDAIESATSRVTAV